MKKQVNTNKKLKVLLIIVSVILIISTIVIYSFYKKNTKDVYVTVGDTKLSEEDYIFYYTLATNNYLYKYNNYLDYLGLDKEKPFDEQYFDEGNNITWKDYFSTLTNSLIQTTISLYDDAKLNNFKEKNDDFYNDFIESFKTAAKERNITYEEYIKEIFSDTMTSNLVEKQLKIYTTALNYSEFLSSEYKNNINDTQINEVYEKNPDNYDMVYYYAFTIKYDTEISEDNEDNNQLTLNTALLRAENVFNAKSLEEFKQLSIENALKEDVNKYKKDNSMYAYATSKQNLYSSIQDWLYDKSRYNGEKVLINDEENSKIFVIYYDKREQNNNSTVNFRHILLTTEYYETEEKLEKAANDMYNYWQELGATETSFINFANTYSESDVIDGLYENIINGELTQEVNEWLFDSRKKGDHIMLEINSGYHIFYFIEYDEPYWKAKIRTEISTEKYETYTNNLLQKNILTFKDGSVYNLLEN